MWVEARNAEEHSARHRITPSNTELSVSITNSAAVEKLRPLCLEYLQWLMIPKKLSSYGQLEGWLVTNARTSFPGGPKPLEIT